MIADTLNNEMRSDEPEAELDSHGHMSFLDHLDELRKRLITSVLILVVAFFACWFVSGYIYDFLSAPIIRAIAEAERRNVPLQGQTGDEKILSLSELKVGDQGRYVFNKNTQLGHAVVSGGATVSAVVAQDADGKLGLFTNELLYTSNAIIPKGVRLPVEFRETAVETPTDDARLTVTTAGEQFTLYVTVSMYSAIAISIPLLLWQIWAFISPGLYKHERAYVTPFILLSSIAFVFGAAFAYKILFPPALKYLLGLGGGEFQLLLKANDYLDFVIIIMLAMGLIFQMPAITYVLARIGIVNAGFLIRSWKVSLIIILIVAAVASPTNDIPNMLLFAAPMIILYIISIFIAWIFGRKRMTDAQAAI